MAFKWYICWTIAIMALDDWIRAVVMAPPNMARIGWFVKSVTNFINSGSLVIASRCIDISSNP
mgnify:CR=1 FL=1